ncbi:MAG: MCE family protein [Fibrobacteria bacterium]|nr:MCE family protein [Fibrobacteria bacterium]
MKIDLRRHMNLLVGFFFFSAITIMIMGLVIMLSLKGMFNPQYELTAVFESGIGLREGTVVLYQGVNIGTVKEINLIYNKTGTKQTGSDLSKVALTFEIDEEFKQFITDKSVAFVMRDKNLVSDRVINIETTDLSSNILQDKDTITVGSSRDIETVLSSLTFLMGKVDTLLVSVGTVLTHVNDSQTTVGALLGSKALYNTIMKDFDQVSEILAIGNRLLIKTEKLESQIEGELPNLFGNVDTTFQSIAEVMTMVEQVVTKVNGLAENMETLLGKVDGVVDFGAGELENASELLEAVSNFWFIKGKIKKQNNRDFPVITDGMGP